MKKSTKGALAAAAAASLLVGGTGTLAFWTADRDVTGGTIRSGDITLSVPDCDGDPAGTHDWQFEDNSAYTGTSKIVPGDTLTKVCDMTLVLTGDHIGAELELESPTFGSSNGLTSELLKDVEFTVEDDPYTGPITDEGTYEIRAELSVELPTGATNGSKNLTAVLNDLTLLATQTHAS